MYLYKTILEHEIKNIYTNINQIWEEDMEKYFSETQRVKIKIV